MKTLTLNRFSVWTIAEYYYAYLYITNRVGAVGGLLCNLFGIFRRFESRRVFTCFRMIGMSVAHGSGGWSGSGVGVPLMFEHLELAGIIFPVRYNVIGLCLCAVRPVGG